MFKYSFCTFSSFLLGPQLKYILDLLTTSLSSVFSIFCPSMLCSKNFFWLFQFTNSLFSFLKKILLLNPSTELLNLVILFFLVLEFLSGSFSDLLCHFLYPLVPYLIFKLGFSLLKHSKYSCFRVCVPGGGRSTIWSPWGSTSIVSFSYWFFLMLFYLLMYLVMFWTLYLKNHLRHWWYYLPPERISICFCRHPGTPAS